MPAYTPDQINLGIIAEGERRGITEKGICIAIATGLVETNSIMYANYADAESLTYPHDAIGSDANSVGVFQQRDPWWGTCYDRMHVEPSAGMFYAELVKHDYNSDAHTPGWYAAEVQQCAEEYRHRYDERYPEACAIYDRLKTTEGPPVMAEIVLEYDSNIVPQETGYWCGPASAQVCLNIRGIHVDEATLAAECGTDEGGTDYHYVTCAGYDSEYPGRALWIADSGFQPFEYWISFDQAATLIPPKAACYANLPHPTTGEPAPDYAQLGYEQLCGAIDPATGYGTGWPQLGTNDAGQNLYVVDALSDILHLLEQGKTGDHQRTAAKTAADDGLDYVGLSYDQLAGARTSDGYGHGWPQLGGRTVTDAVAHIKNVLSEQPGEPPPFPAAVRRGGDLRC